MNRTEKSAGRPALSSPTLALVTACGLCAGGGALAQQSIPAPAAAVAASAPAGASALPRVEVIGLTPLPGLGVPKDRVPANVQTATGADIERSHALDLTEFVNRRLGSVYVNETQNNPFQPDVTFRGFTASPLLGAQQGLSVYVDGVRMNQPFGDVVSWDLIPKSAIGSIALMPGSNPLFGLNTLGGALSVQTKDGLKDPGTSVQVTAGSHKRWALEFETGGSRDDGLNWFVTGNRFRETGWRDDSPSDVQQLFTKLGTTLGATTGTLTLALARTDLHGNGLQDQRLLADDYASVYTKPDDTRNRSVLLNLALAHDVSDTLSFSGNVYYRKIRTSTYNGDINDDSLTESLYQPDADEQAALTEAGYTGFPTSGEYRGNTPFPKWRCIANALLGDEPAKQCNGLINQTHTDQSNYGLSAQVNVDRPLFGLPHQFVVGAAFDASRIQFNQGSELGYLNPDRSITGVGAFGDGVTGGTVDGAPYDTRVDLSGRTRTYSLYASSVLALTPTTFLTLSGRYNRIHVRNADAILPGGGPGSLDGDNTFSRFNPAAGLTFSVRPGVTGYAGINQGSRAPSSVELGCADPENPCKLPNAFAGDPPLRQVVTTTLEAGLRGSARGAYAWNVGVFRSDNRDDLLFVSDNASGFGYFKNFGKTRRQGLELGGNLVVAKDLVVGANYTYLDATFRSAEVVDGSANSSSDAASDGFPGVGGTIRVTPGNRIPLVPRHILKLYTDVQLSPTWSVGGDMTAIGSSIARGNENGQHQPDGVYYLGPGRNPGYAVFSLNTEYKPTPSLTLFAQVSNLLDRRYSTAAQLGATGLDANGNFIARPFPADAHGDRPLVSATFYSPGAPRSFLVGLKYAFGGP